MPAFCATHISPIAVPKRDGDTSRLASGHITAGTSEKLTPISAVETHRLVVVSAISAIATGSSTAPKARKGA